VRPSTLGFHFGFHCLCEELREPAVKGPTKYDAPWWHVAKPEALRAVRVDFSGLVERRAHGQGKG